MAVEALTATRRHLFPLVDDKQVPTHQGTNTLTATVEMTAGAEATSTYWMGRVPTNARIMPGSELFSDDLATTGSPTIDIGLFAVGANVTSDDDALNDGIGVAAAAAVTRLVKDHANFGKRAWEFVNGVTSDPGGFLDIKLTLKDAACDSGGTLTLALVYTVD